MGRRDIGHALGALGGEAPSDAVELAALVLPVLQNVIAASPTGHELMSIFGWLTLKEAERYTRAAEQKRLAEGAMSLVERTST